MNAPEGRRPKLDLFWVSLPICAGVASFGIAYPDSMAHAAKTLTGTSFRALDWFFMVSVTGFLIASIWLAFGRYGGLKLGGPDDDPEFSVASWLTMLFSAGMGVGLLFWGVAEPMSHFSSPPVGEASTAQAARHAMVITNFHWGLHAWAVYCVGALVLAYFGFRRGAPYLAGAPIRFAFRGAWVGPVAKIADLVAVLAVAFGVAGSIGMGVLQLHAGLYVVVGASMDSTVIPIAILVVLAICYMASAATSLDRGIKWLSNFNMSLALLLMVFVLAAGPTPFLLRTTATALGDYVTNFVGMSLSLFPFRDLNGWLESWTLTYFIWWIAWAPFVGIFIARISRGRTIREFVLGVLLAPTLFSILWFGVFGGMGFFEELHGDGGMARLVSEDVTVALFSLYERLPLTGVLSAISIVLVFVFLVTSVDSATFVLGMLTSRGTLDPPVSRKLGWGLSLGGLGAALMLSGNIDVVRAVAISGAIPFTFILIIQLAALLRCLREEAADLDDAATIDQIGETLERKAT